MRVAYIATGAAGMYCGTCMHDNTLARALMAAGHDVVLIPTYTPMRTDEPDVSLDRVFYGAINVYLQQKAGLFRHMPAAMDRLLDRPGLLNQVSRLSSSTDAKELGALTLSVLSGEAGRQAKELAKLVEWLRDGFKPQVVHLNNAMFLGMARTLKRELRAPVFCALQGEDLFLDGLSQPFRGRVFAELRERAKDVDGFFAPSRYYASHMAEVLGVPLEKIHIVPLGLWSEGHEGPPSPRSERGTATTPSPSPFVVGYLARICPEKGLHVLIEAFHQLAKERLGVRLRVAGYLGAQNADYCEDLKRRVESWGLRDGVDWVGEVDRQGKLAFLDSIDVLSVPTTYQEPKGIYVLEGFAHGVPVVVPRHGSFPELLEDGGGLLVEPGSADAVAEGLRALMDDPARRARLGEEGKAAVRKRHDSRVEAEATAAVYSASAAGAA